jgi:predicted ribosome quality control (RQC) complex YloA/Tae2 family protein
MQQVDFTTLTAACQELSIDWIPSRLETVYQFDKHTVALGLRNFTGRGWLGVSWHPEASRIAMTQAPPKIPDTFTFSQQLKAQLGGLALVAIAPIAPWERVMDLQFARRPGDPIEFHLFVEVMGKYSNATLTDADRLIISTAHQVSGKQSSVRTVQTGQPYELPPGMLSAMPKLSESIEDWQERVSLLPGLVTKRLIASYRGLSTALTSGLLVAAGLAVDSQTSELSKEQWQLLFIQWQSWLEWVEAGDRWQPVWTEAGYSVMGWGDRPAKSVNALVDGYFQQILGRSNFGAVRQQLLQKLKVVITKLEVKAQTFRSRLAESVDADLSRSKADLLMAYLHLWQPGMKKITLADFETGEDVSIDLQPEKNCIQNAQALYKQFQKLKRAQTIVVPLLAAVDAELNYLAQVENSVGQIEVYQQLSDLETLIEIKEELILSGYMAAPANRSPSAQAQLSKSLAVTLPHCFTSPSGFEVLIGRNNRQNDVLTFKTATDYDLWFHAQEIAGSHGLLRLPAGEVAQEADLQYTANMVAYHSRSRQSTAVPVVYTTPKHVYKPKGAQLGMVVYKHERIIWGNPQVAAKDL